MELHTSQGRDKKTFPNRKGFHKALPFGATNAPYGFYEYLPINYHTSSKEFPLMIFLHGAGESGNGTTQLSSVLRHGPPKLIEQGRDFDALVFSPQSSVWWNMRMLNRFLNFIFENYRVDRKRIYITGVSMGGGGTWLFTRTFPHYPTAIVPICGAITAGDADQLRGIPTWAFHAIGDDIVSSQYTMDHMNIISSSDLMKDYPGTDNTYTATFDDKWNWKQGQGIDDPRQDLIMTMYPDDDHDSWTRAYENEDMWKWLFSQSK